MAGSASEDSPSPLPQGANNTNHSKTEQEKKARIRDNQRRSRARRQEHLLDLERRLTESHTAVREADIQRSAFKDLQIENARLRDLLRVAGIDETLTQNYVNQGMIQLQDPGTSHRYIRPRITLQQDETSLPQARDDASSEGSNMSLLLPPKTTAETLDSSEPSQHLLPSAFYRLGSTTLLQQPSTLMSTPRCGQQCGQQQRQSISNCSPVPETFCCDTFLVPANGRLLQNSENTILCSVANDIIQQYNVGPDDMDWIKARLATGFCKPALPGQGCRVNSQLLFQVLNVISSQLAGTHLS